MSSSRKNLEITSSNHTSTGVVSFKSGNPVLQFIIGESDMTLIGSSIRLCGQFRIRGNSSSANTIPQNASNLRISEQLGMFSIVDQLVIKSQATHQVIEEIKNYQHFMAAYLPTTTSMNDNITHLSQQALVLPNYQAHKRSVVDIVTGNTSAAKAGNSFCIHLPCGLFNGQNPIPLMQNAQGGLGGLLVEIHLSPDSNVLFGQDGTSSEMNEAFYELSNVYLTAEAVANAPASTNTFEFNSISSYYTTFNSANAIINFNLGLSRVLGVFGNITSASMINTVTANGLAANYPVNSDGSVATINQLFFLKGGEKFPIEYNINSLQRNDATDQSADAQIQQEFMNAIQKFNAINRTMVKATTTEVVAADPTGAMNTRVNGGLVVGIGCAYDVISGNGVDFSSQNFGIQMETGITTDSPQALYLFVHSKQTLMFSQNGIRVVK
tara:strand:- start:876 stop:2192 length:1317 start_codon:yes stop_codon:yes gene_type:complete